MAAKDVKFSGDARERLLRGVDILADAVKVTVHDFPRVRSGRFATRARPPSGP